VAELDTPGLESSPSISDDGLFFFFGSTRPGGVGQSDWYVATRPNRNAPFGRASNVSEMNSIRAEFNGTITRDCFSFYSSATPAGAATSDILRFDGVLPETSATAAQVGQPWTIRCRRDAGDFAFIFLALYETTGISLQGVQGRLFLGLPPVPLLLGVGILDQDGVFPLTVLVPADPVLVGITLFTQTVAQDSAAAIYLSRTHRAVTIQP
jgi:hypothetical protein